MIERWRRVPRAPHLEVSDCGRVRSWRGRNGWDVPEPREIKPFITKYGYLGVALTGSSEFVHVLVLEVFVRPKDESSGREVTLHLDGDKQNNNLSNLKWGTPLENKRDGIDRGEWGISRGSSHGMSRLSEEDVRLMRAAVDATGGKASNKLRAEFAERFNVSINTVNDAIYKRRKRWSHV